MFKYYFYVLETHELKNRKIYSVCQSSLSYGPVSYGMSGSAVVNPVFVWTNFKITYTDINSRREVVMVEEGILTESTFHCHSKRLLDNSLNPEPRHQLTCY